MRNSRQHFLIMSTIHRPPGTLALLASGQYCPYRRMTPVSQLAARRSMRKSVPATARAAGCGTARLLRGAIVPLIGHYLREYGKLDVCVRDSHESCQTVN
jgi:hypothetical protein